MSQTDIQNFEIYETNSLLIHGIVVDDAGQAIDIDGMSIVWGIYRVKDKVIVLQKETGDGITITDPAEGLFDIVLTPAETRYLGGESYYHEAVVIDGDDQSTVLFGVITIHKSPVAAALTAGEEAT